jgi:hypothetical protein
MGLLESDFEVGQFCDGVVSQARVKNGYRQWKAPSPTFRRRPDASNTLCYEFAGGQKANELRKLGGNLLWKARGAHPTIECEQGQSPRRLVEEGDRVTGSHDGIMNRPQFTWSVALSSEYLLEIAPIVEDQDSRVVAIERSETPPR